MYPVYIMDKGTQLPESGIYYVVAGNGIFIHKDIGVIDAFVPVDKISFLEKVNLWATHKLPKIPVELIAQFICFAKDIFNQFQSEAVVLLYYSMNERKFLLICPAQSSSGVRVNYARNINVAGHRQVGTIHSHPDFSAYHSTIDENDENGFDGVHITLGDVVAPCFSVSVELAVNGTRFKLSPESIIEGIREVKIDDVGTGPADSGINRDLSLPKEISREQKFLFPIDLPLPIAMALESNLELVLAAEKAEPLPKTNQPKRYQLFRSDGQLIESVVYPKSWLENVGGLIRKASQDDFEEEVKNGHQSHRRRRHRLLSFTLFSKVFTISVQRQRNNKNPAH